MTGDKDEERKVRLGINASKRSAINFQSRGRSRHRERRLGMQGEQRSLDIVLAQGTLPTHTERGRRARSPWRWMEGTLFFAPDIHSKHPAPTGVEGGYFLHENKQKKLLTFLVLTIYVKK